MKNTSNSLKHRIRVCGITDTSWENGLSPTAQSMIAMTRTMNMKTRLLRPRIILLEWIMEQQMRPLLYYAESPLTSGLKYEWNQNITMIPLKEVGLKRTKNWF